MVQENHMQVHFDAKSVNEGLARMVVTAFMTNMNPTLEQIADVKTAVSEAVTNAIIHGYEDYGENILKKIRGMFAFAIWDKVKETLFMARDMFGIKPLYYTQNTLDGSFLFGSEIKSFLKHPNFIKELNNDALKPYLTFQYSVMDETFFNKAM